MVKRLRLQENPSVRRRKRKAHAEGWVFEPRDAGLFSVMLIATLWLQWLLDPPPA